MCGRYSLTTPTEALRDLFGFAEQPNLAARANIAPTQEVPALRLEEGARHLRMLRWGLVPFWAKDAKIANKLINARGETVSTTPSYRAAFKTRRCLILADGFYEWRKEKDAKQPYRVTLVDGGPFAFAGLWEVWRDPESREDLESCTIITTDANATLEALHARMPVILAPADHGAWLDPAAPADALQGLLRPAPEGALVAYPVSRAINNVRNDDPALIEPIGPPLGETRQASLL